MNNYGGGKVLKNRRRGASAAVYSNVLKSSAAFNNGIIPRW